MIEESNALSEFRNAIQNDLTRRNYENRQSTFLRQILPEGSTLEEKAQTFVDRSRQDTRRATSQIDSYTNRQKIRAESNEISKSTLPNYFKPIKLFLTENSILLNWKKISRLIPHGKKSANDMAPTLDEIREISLKIKNESNEDQYAKLLMTVPGIGYYSALLISSEIVDIQRFPDSHHLSSYAGLTPSIHSSGGVTYNGSMTRSGSKYLRWILVECVHSHIRTEKESNLTKFYMQLAKRRGGSKPSVASASKLLRIIYSMLKEKRSYCS